MHKSFDLYFVSSNNHKYQEAKTILDSFGIKLGFIKLNLEEIQCHCEDEIQVRNRVTIRNSAVIFSVLFGFLRNVADGGDVLILVTNLSIRIRTWGGGCGVFRFPVSIVLIIFSPLKFLIDYSTESYS